MKKHFLLLACSLGLTLLAYAEQKPETHASNETAAQKVAEPAPTTPPSSATPDKREYRKLTSNELVAQYIATGLFGALTGAGCHIVEKQNSADFYFPWSWLLEFSMRAGVLQMVEEDMQKKPRCCTSPWSY
jgi:hypothetical protein